MAVASAETNDGAPFSFGELSAPPEDGSFPTTNATVVASDGIELAVRVYKPPSESSSDTALVFYHGGGAHAGAGYQHLGRGLAKDHGITVYTPDLRGHGASGGPRGDAPSREQVWRDIDTVLSWVAASGMNDENKKPWRRIFLGGHSSGGGLVVNYATTAKKAMDSDAVAVDGYVLVSPELGYASGTARPGRTDFAEVSILSFIANGICGILGHHHAVRFRYPAKILEDDPGMVGSNTVNMANAITPERPKEQVSAMSGGNGGKQEQQPSPVGLWIGADDELFTAESVAGFVDTTSSSNNNNNNVAEVLPGKTHLGILVDVHEPIGRWIGRLPANDAE